MLHRREYDIAFVGLKPGVHEFNYSITTKFFESFQQQDFTNCNATVKLLLDRKSSFMLLKFEINGILEVVCDRCSNNLPMDLWDEFTLTVKMVDNPEEMNNEEEDPDVYYVGRQESHLNVENWIYEFINLSIPMQKVCNFDQADGPNCNKEAMKLLKKMEPDTTTGPSNSEIWKGLEKFKKKDN